MVNSIDKVPDRPPARRVRDLRPRQWLLLVETAATLAAASAAIAILPFRTVVRIASRGKPAGRSSALGPADVGELRWAVEAISWRVPWRTVCFQKGLTLHVMLRRRGIASVMQYGVGKDDAGALAAHVWIDIDDHTVQGGEVAHRFVRLASYPGD